MKLLIKNIGKLLQVAEPNQGSGSVKGEAMKQLPHLNNAWLAAEDGKIIDFGTMDTLSGITDWSNLTVIDAEGRFVMPTWVDSHTHIVYAAPRESEFVDKIKGFSYEQIAANGGGILNSAALLRTTPEEVLFESAWQRLQEMIAFGTGAIEIKSGYGLSLESELKMLRVIKKLKATSPITIKANLLAAHALPPEFKQNRKGYIDLIIDKILPQAVDEGLADFVDVFCDRGFFTVDETDQILSAAAKYGLRGKIHANELDYSGGIQVGVKHNALSVDHLECTGDEEIETLIRSETMPTLLPGTAFFLRLHYPPARKMIDAGLAVALATDFNPGSCPSGNMPFILSLACIQMRMLPEEAINAATVNAAIAMDVQNQLGNIAIGKTANFILTKPMPDVAFIPYSFGSNPVEKVILNGKIFK